MTKSAADIDAADLPVTIPSEKAKAREWLSVKINGVPVTKCPPQTAPEPKPHKPRKYETAAANDNDPVPLCEALMRDKRPEDAMMIRRYRSLFEIAGSPDAGRNVEVGQGGINFERRISFVNGLEKDHGIRERKPLASTGNRNSISTDDVPHAISAPLCIAGGEDSIIAYMDAKVVIGRLRAALGPLLTVFEEAAIDCETLTAIGERQGFKGKQASAAAKAPIYMAVDTLRDAWRLLNKEMTAAAKEADRKVQIRRREVHPTRCGMGITGTQFYSKARFGGPLSFLAP
ncbi:hypothetical protein [Pseudochrobactrum sp. MP213Fo]|uniref:hypothetical protein n=1 Tax=Pseudochrobactrum sp. MP213Fo TaxID=3022250 RepID=UPI003BA145D3